MTPTDPTIEAVAKVICRSGKFETGEGTCSLRCMEFLGSPRKSGCAHAASVHGDLAQQITAYLTTKPSQQSQPDRGSLVKRKYDPLLKGRKANHPIGNGECLVGFVLPEKVAGLSDGLFMLDALLAALQQSQPPAADEVEAVARALHEEFSRQNIMAYLEREFDLHAAARIAISTLRSQQSSEVGGISELAKSGAALLAAAERYESAAHANEAMMDACVGGNSAILAEELRERAELLVQLIRTALARSQGEGE